MDGVRRAKWVYHCVSSVYCPFNGTNYSAWMDVCRYSVGRWKYWNNKCYIQSGQKDREMEKKDLAFGKNNTLLLECLISFSPLYSFRLLSVSPMANGAFRFWGC